MTFILTTMVTIFEILGSLLKEIHEKPMKKVSAEFSWFGQSVVNLVLQ